MTPLDCSMMFLHFIAKQCTAIRPELSIARHKQLAYLFYENTIVYLMNFHRIVLLNWLEFNSLNPICFISNFKVQIMRSFDGRFSGVGLMHIFRWEEKISSAGRKLASGSRPNEIF